MKQVSQLITDWQRNRRSLMRITSVTAAVLTALYGTPASAADDTAQGDALQEVVVTASRRAVSAQDLPISITAVTGPALEASRYRGHCRARAFDGRA